MGVAKSVGASVGRRAFPRIAEIAPDATQAFVREALDKAIAGVGPLPGAAVAAEKKLAKAGGDIDKAVHAVIERNVRYAGTQGFVTNLGGVISAPVTIPANIAALALIECRMVAGIAHLRGYDLADPRTRNAILAALLGEDEVLRMLRKHKLPGTPMALATAPVVDPGVERAIATEVAVDLLSRVSGKRLASLVGRRIPVLGGLVGLTADGYAAWNIGRYADREFLPRSPR
ncbi:EcsC family protein [Nocardioides limicola]|uniref:EcsC family protein n=1 Tax=Nocardioides limicola TaxID=2803368 RepID=UPI00193B52A4|nr:EcsC family protein [Nocardioides sp. DJM-14]